MCPKRTLLILHLFAICATILFCAGCSRYNKFTVGFTRVSHLTTKSSVRINGQIIGYVSDFKPNEKLDTIFTILKINKRVRIPQGSVFVINENPLGNSEITVELANNKNYMTSKQISIGIFRPIQYMSNSQTDSAEQRMKLILSPSKVDSSKNK